MTMDVNALANVRGDYLTARMQDLRRQERRGLAEFLACLGEMERRRLHLELGFGSIFAYLVEQFGYDKASAYRRWKACGLVARFPILVEYVADGRLGLITLVLLRDVLDEARLGEVLDRAAGRTVEEVERLVAALAPEPAPAEMIRRLPVAAAADAANGFTEKPGDLATAPLAGPAPPAAPAQPARPATVEPINATQHVVRFTVDDGFLADLAAVKALLSHQYPAGALAGVLHHCMRRTLDAGRRRGGRRAARPTAPDSLHTPAVMEAEVRRRDGGSCAYVAPDGRRCGSTHQLEVHHLLARGKQGATTLENLGLRCRAHNRFHAEQDFGVEHVARAIAASQQPLF